MDKKYVVFAATGVGLGHLLSALMSTAYYAWRHGCVLALDMREVHFFAQNNHEAFFENFALQFPPALEITKDLALIELLRSHQDLHFLRLEDRLDVEKAFPNKVLMVPCISPGDPFRKGYARSDAEFHIDLRGPLREAFEKAQSLPQWSRRVIGLHYRATVGEVFDRMTKLTVPDYDVRYSKIMDDYVSKALSLVETEPSDGYAFLIASDDRTFVTEMKQRLPNAFSLSTKLLDQEFAAYVRQNNFDISILMDAVVDLWCLSQCEHLIHSRSAFSHFAIVNSPALDETNTHYVHMPLFDEILDSVPSTTAVEWARAAVREVEIRRMHYTKSHQSLIRVLKRAIDEQRAEHSEMVGENDGPVGVLQAELDRVRRRTQWHWEITHSPDVDAPTAFETRAWEREGRNDAWLERTVALASKFPGNPFFLSGYGGSVADLLTRLGRLHDAVEPARQAVRLAPDDAFLAHALGVTLARAGQPEEAEKILRQAIEIDTKVSAFYNDLADALTRQGKVDEAIKVTSRALELNLGDAATYARLGEALLTVERYAEAEEAFMTAIRLNPRDPAYFHRLSIACERQGRIEDAIHASEQGALADPSRSYSLERAAMLRKVHKLHPTDPYHIDELAAERR
jgi:Flp pilus assembly protein TadD